MSVMQIRFDALENDPSFAVLVDAYTSESSIKRMPPIAPNWDFYRSADTLGLLKTLAAYSPDEALIGFILMLHTIVPHYSLPIATLESYYVHPDHRASPAGLRLLRTAEALASELGCVGLFVSAPYGGQLAEVMQRMKGYEETNRVFFRSLAA